MGAHNSRSTFCAGPLQADELDVSCRAVELTLPLFSFNCMRVLRMQDVLAANRSRSLGDRGGRIFLLRT